jgi:hypothetical protein
VSRLGKVARNSSAGPVLSELAAPYFGGERPPFIWSEDQHWAVPVLRVANRDEVVGPFLAALDSRDFDAAAVPATAGALTPFGAVQVSGAHWPRPLVII